MWRILVFKVFEARMVCKNRNKSTVSCKKLAGNPVRCVCVLVDKEPVRGTPNEKLSVTSVTYVQVRTILCCNLAEKLASTSRESRKKEHTVRCELETHTVQSRGVVGNAPREMILYGGKDSPVWYSAMWITGPTLQLKARTVFPLKVPYGAGVVNVGRRR